MEDNERRRLLKRGRWLEVATLSYNLLEASITVTIGIINGSAALVSFGLDASVEALSAGMLLWRLVSEEKGASQRTLAKRKKWSFYVLCGAFVVLAGFIVYESISKLLSQKTPDFSSIAVGILLASLLIKSDTFLLQASHW